jgi:hypothetical protein
VWIDPGTAVKLAEQVTGTSTRDWVTWLRDIYRLATKGRLQLFLVGCGGTGKTSLKRYLINRDAEKVPAQHHSTITREREVAQKIEALSHIYDYPGQANRFNKEFERDATTFNSSYRTLVMMCCAYGYHSDWGRGAALGERPRAISANTTNLEAALEDCRQAELNFVREFLQDHVRHAKRVDMLTFVLKQDLWFDQQEAVAEFYGNHYSEIIDDFEKNRSNFTHDLFPCCLRRENFDSRIGASSEIRQSLPGFTATVEQSYRRIALNALESLVRRSQG